MLTIAPPSSPDAAIGLIDSGLGGLETLKTLTQALPGERFVCFCDRRALPFGDKSPAAIRQHIEIAARYLVQEHGVKVLVLACNTASALALTSLRLAFPATPVVGTILPAGAAIKRSGYREVAVLATQATVKSGAYLRMLSRAQPGITVHQIAAPLLVHLCEAGLQESPAAQALLVHYLRDIFLGARPPQALVLGCTHFGGLVPSLHKVLGPFVDIIDPGPQLGVLLHQRLDRLGLRAIGGTALGPRIIIHTAQRHEKATLSDYAAALIAPFNPTLETVVLGGAQMQVGNLVTGQKVFGARRQVPAGNDLARAVDDPVVGAIAS